MTPDPPAGDGLVADVALTRGSLDLRVHLAAPAGSVVALLGPNGAGKTSLLRALAGLDPLREGRVSVAGQVWEDTARGLRLPPERRAAGVLFQDYLLFPRMSALANVAFGLRSRGAERRGAEAAALDQLAAVGLADLAGRRPGELSGGQQQRVALARALAPRPALLLLDEPLAALDAGTRVDVRRLLRATLADYPGVAVLITHDPVDALVLGDRVAVLERGRLVQAGPPDSVARQPRTDYVARLVGLTLLAGTRTGDRVDLDGGGRLTVTGTGSGPVLVAVRPSAVGLYRERPAGSPRNVWPGTVAVLERHGDAVRASVTGTPPATVDLTPAAVAELGLTEGSPVWLSVKATDLAVYPA